MTLPSESYTTTVGDAMAVGPFAFVSGEIRLPRLTVKTLSCESTQVPATSPVTHGRGLPVAVLVLAVVPNWPATGSGFGQFPSTCKTGTLGLLGGSALLAVQRPAPTATDK